MPESTNKGRLRNDNIDTIFKKLEGGNKPSSGAGQFHWKYPYELTSAESQHFILFTCFAEGPATFETSLIKQTKGRGGSIADTLSSAFGGGGAAGFGGINNEGGSNEQIVSSSRIGAERDLQPQETIALYMTPQVAYQQKTDWEMNETQKDGWGGWLGDLVSNFAQGALDKFTTAGGENNRLASNGEAKNPNKEALFKEMTERSFSFNFTFVPKVKKKQKQCIKSFESLDIILPQNYKVVDILTRLVNLKSSFSVAVRKTHTCLNSEDWYVLALTINMVVMEHSRHLMMEPLLKLLCL